MIAKIYINVNVNYDCCSHPRNSNAKYRYAKLMQFLVGLILKKDPKRFSI
jgi:hypothetical protein